jgi:lipid II:glycine glycyltransferase (peptidoglycan interpeptide bridge formation enzyme)
VSAIHEERGADLGDWDARAVDAPGGHIYQSRAWGEFQASLGWRVRYLRFDDGFPALVLQRRWPWIGGSSAYVSRGPVPTDSPGETAQRQVELARWLSARGVAVIAADPEVEAATSFTAKIQSAGFRPIEELQPSRHRMRLPLAGRTEEEVFRGIAKSTRQRIRRAEESDLNVVQHSAAPADAELLAFYDLLRATGDRRGFALGSREEFVGWWKAALAAGRLVYLAARTSDNGTIAGLLLYRHGGRLSTVHSADLASVRQEHPGVLHLLRWRGIQLALASGCAEIDLGGVDVVGARRVPEEGESMLGLYEHKRSFGAEWVELAGAHEYVADRLRYAAGRVTQRIARQIARRRPGSRS